MNIFRFRRTRNSVNKKQRYPLYAAIVIILALCVALTVAIIQNNRLGKLTDVSLNEMAAATQSDIKSAVRESEKITLPGADVKNTILHNMRVHLYAAKTMNESMINVYDFNMLDDDAYNEAQSAIDGIEKQITAGRAYSEQLDQLLLAMARLEENVDSHFADDENSLAPSSNVR